MAKESIVFGRGRDVRGRVALRDVFEARYEPLVAQLYGLTGDLREAEQLAQEACVRAAAAERRFRRAADREAWLRAAAVGARRTRARRSLLRRRRPHREGSPPETSAPDFDELVCRGVRRRTRRRTGVVAAAYGIAVVAGAVALVDHEPSPPPPASTTVPVPPGLSEVEEVGDRIPPGRAGMPAAVPGAPVAATVEIPRGVWRESSTGSGVYSPIRRGTAWLKVATFLVDGVVGQPCRTSSVPASLGIPAAFERPGVTRDALADAISGLPRADVSIPAHTEARWGTLVVHVSVRMPHATCRNGNLLWTFDTRRSGEFVGNDHARLDFWIAELDGRALVVEAEQPMGTSAAERRRLNRLVESIELDGRPPG
jgi:RNA polymerase sigma-70 factor (ECF subfamily)